MTRTASPVLWHLEVSHYNEKARWALDLKGVPHVRRAVTPGLQPLRARRLRAGRTTPILQVDGRAIGDSTGIIGEIERRWPDPPLYPSDPAARRRALALEDDFDEIYGPETRRTLFATNLGEPERLMGIFAGPGNPRRRKVVGTVLAPVIRQVFEIRPERVVRSVEVVEAAFARVEAEVGPAGYLVGDSFTVADLTAASILAVIVVPPQFPYINLPPDDRAREFRELRDSLRERPGFRWVEDMYARHRGASAEVAAGGG